ETPISERDTPFGSILEPDPARDFDDGTSSPALRLELPPVDETSTVPIGKVRRDGREAGSGTSSETSRQRDDNVRRIQAPGRPNSGYSNSEKVLPPARQPLGGTSSADPESPIAAPFFLPTERLATGPNTVGLKVEVSAPEFANLNLENTFWIKVTNVGPADAL